MMDTIHRSLHRTIERERERERERKPLELAASHHNSDIAQQIVMLLLDADPTLIDDPEMMGIEIFCKLAIERGHTALVKSLLLKYQDRL